MIRLAHLSDIHFGGENVAATQAALERVAAEAPDAVIVSGDITQFGEKAEFAAAAAWLARLPAPVLTIPGNHDAPYLAWYERFFTPFARYEKAVGAADRCDLRIPGLAVYGLNTARGVQPRANWSKGQISKAQVDRAVAWFAQVPEPTARILVCHHPLLEMIGGPMTGRVWGGTQAAERLAQARVDLVLTGHIHAPFVWPYPFGDGNTLGVGAGTLSMRERGVPPGFNLIEIDELEIRVIALAFERVAFQPFRTWSTPRRPPA
ncbi:MAG TPA: metallophosphoesterase [Phenylobacterium sp.]|nr:metallophosphoesterase [Phenylobacterium sp.]